MTLFRGFVHWLGKQPWFARVGRKLTSVDLALQRRTRGRMSLLRLVGTPSLALTATGCRSGQPRTVPLLYAPHRHGFLVVGSNWGRRRHPAWSANLLAHPDAVVWTHGRRIPVRARLVTGSERDRLWREVITRVWPAYDSYAEWAAGREIRVFLLVPR